MVYQKGSFSKAAQALYLTQPALSIAIQKVEHEIGMPLFDRSQKPLALTEAGRFYIETLEQMRILEKQLNSQLLDLTSMNTGNVHIGASTYFISCILPPVLIRFKRKYPGVTLNITEAGSYELRELLKEQKVDITFLSHMEEGSPFKGRPAFRDRILLAVPADLPVNSLLRDFSMTSADVQAGQPWQEDQPCVDLTHFGQIPFVLLKPQYDLRRRADSFFEACGVEPNICMEVSQIVTSYALAQAGIGAAFVPDRTVTRACPELVFYKLDFPRTVRNMSVATNRKSYVSTAVSQFIEMFTAYYGEEEKKNKTPPPPA